MKKIAMLLIAAMFATILSGCKDSRETIIIYTSAEEYRVEYMQKRMKEEFPQYNVIIEYMSSGDHAAKLMAAGKDVECDITHDLEYSYASQIAAKGYLTDLSDLLDFSVYAEDAVQSTYYAPEVRNGGAVIVNLDVIKEKGLEMPTSYQDLLDPQYHELISMPNPGSSGTGYMFLISLVNAWGEEAAFEYFDQLTENVLSYTSSGSGPVNALTTKEVAIGLGMTPQAVTKINEGVNLQTVFFEEGSPFSLYGQGIIEGKDDRECVKEVFTFLATTLTEEQNELYYPEKIFKDKSFTIENFPTDITYANMNDNTSERKEDLLSKWTH